MKIKIKKFINSCLKSWHTTAIGLLLGFMYFTFAGYERHDFKIENIKLTDWMVIVEFIVGGFLTKFAGSNGKIVKKKRRYRRKSK